MNRHMAKLVSAFLFALFCLALPASAQDAAPTTSPEITLLNDRIVELQRRIDDAENMANRNEAIVSGNAMENLLSYVNNGIAIVTVVFTVVTFGLGLFGFQELLSSRRAREEAIKEVNTKLADAVQERKAELTALSERLEENAKRVDKLLEARQQNLKNLETTLNKRSDDADKRSDDAILAMGLLPLGERQYLAGDLNGAIQTYQRALKLNERNPITLYRLGYVYVHANRLQEAVAMLKEALQKDPDFTQATAALGYTYRRIAEKIDEGSMERDRTMIQAEQYLTEALDKSPNMIDEDGESWWGALGGLYRRDDRIDKAIHAYEQARLVTNNSSYPAMNLALLHMKKDGHFEQMMEHFRLVLDLARDEARARVDDHWAIADLLVAELACYHNDHRCKEDVFPTMQKFLALVRASYPLEVLQGTLIDLRRILTAQKIDTAYLEQYIDQLTQQIDSFNQNQPPMIDTPAST